MIRKRIKIFNIIIFLLTFLSIQLFSLEKIKRGVFLWPSTIGEYGQEKIIRILHKNKITDVFLLVKGESGATLFPSTYTYENLYEKLAKSGRKNFKKYKKLSEFFKKFSLKNFIEKAHKKGIKVHAWFMVSADENFIRNNPGAEAIHLQKPKISQFPYPQPQKPHVNLSYPPYFSFFISLVKKSLNFKFDGIMLDKIRYTHLVYSWDNFILSEALRRGINIGKVNLIAYQSIYGNPERKDEIIYNYRDGDPDVVKWVKLRRGVIKKYVKKVKEIIGNKLQLSAAFMPEGAYDENFADVYYGQNYEELAKYLDFFVIMAYPKAFDKPPTWIKLVIENAKIKEGKKVWVAIQGFDNVSSSCLEKQILNARISSPSGIALFRFGEMERKWKSFNNGFKLRLFSRKKKEIRGIIYKGKGTIRNCWLKSGDALIISSSITPIFLNEKQLKNFSYFNKKDFILIPGGGGSSIAKALGKRGLNNIKKFVKSGGGYIGICAGSFLPIKGYWNNLTRDLEIVNAEAVDVDHWNRGSGMVSIKILKNHFIFGQYKRGEKIKLKYFSGPVLKKSNFKNLPPYNNLAIFLTDIHKNGAKEGEMLGKTAILETKYHKGRIILFSPHPELTENYEWIISRAAIYVSK